MKHFLRMLAFGAISFVSTTSLAQTRDLGANRIVYDDNNGNTIIARTQPSGGWTGARIWNIPLPPNNSIESGFVGKGTANNDLLAWDATLQYWKSGTTTDHGLVTSIPLGTVNALPRFTSGSNLGNSRITDNGSVIAIDGSDMIFDYTTGLTSLATDLRVGQNAEVRGYLWDGTGALTIDDQAEVTGQLTLGNTLVSNGPTLIIDDNLNVAGTLANNNAFTPLTISDDIIVTGITEVRSHVFSSVGAYTIDDGALITGPLNLGNTLGSTGATLVIDDNLNIAGNLANNNAFTPLTIDDDLVITGITQIYGNVYDPTGAFTIDDALHVTGVVTLANTLGSSGTTLVIDDNLNVAGDLANNNAFTPLQINDDVVITGTAQIYGNVYDPTGAFTIDDGVSITGGLSLGGSLSATPAALLIDDDVQISGMLSNNNGATPLQINDDLVINGGTNVVGTLFSSGGPLSIGDHLDVSGMSEFHQLVTMHSFVANSPAGANEITFGDANPNRTGLAITNLGAGASSRGLAIGQAGTLPTTGAIVSALNTSVYALSENQQVNSAGNGFQGTVSPSLIGDGIGAAVIARGRAVAGSPEQYSNAIILQNGAFAVAGIAPAGRIENVDLSVATNVVINNPLCTSSSLVLVTAVSQDAANANLYVSTASDGSFTVTRAGAPGSGVDFNYFIITYVNP